MVMFTIHISYLYMLIDLLFALTNCMLQKLLQHINVMYRDIHDILLVARIIPYY